MAAGALFSTMARAAGDPLDADNVRFYPARYYPGVADSNQAQILQPAPGQDPGPLDLRVDPMGATIQGTVRAQGAGTPLEGVLVEADVHGRRSLARSDAQGHFAIRAVPAGSALLRYSTDDRFSLETHHLALYYPGVPDLPSAGRVAVTNGGNVNVNDVLLPPSAYLAGVVRTGDTGLPMKKLRLRIDSRSGGGSWTVYTAADGTFHLGGIPAGDYVVGAVTQGTPYIPVWFDGARDAGGATVLSVAAGEERTGLEIRPPLGGSISGGVSRSANHAPVAGARVEATDVLTGNMYTAVTGEDGTYTIIGLPSGSYRVYVPLILKYYIDTQVQGDAKPVQVTEPADTPDINLTGTPITDCRLLPQSAGVITGWITADLAQVGRIVVRAWSDQDTLDLPIDLPGSYTLGCLPAGLYKVALLADGPLAAQYYPMTNDPAEAQLVTVAPGDTAKRIDFRPQAAVTLHGTVSERVTGAPVAGAGVVAVELSTRLTARAVTGDDGGFLLDRIEQPRSMRTGLPSGRWRVMAESTLISDPQVTPILQPWIQAAAADSGSVRLSWRLAAGFAWRYRIERWVGDLRAVGHGGLAGRTDLTGGSPVGGDLAGHGLTSGGDLVLAGEVSRDSPDSTHEWLDSPSGRGPFTYALTATLLGPGGIPAGGADSSRSVFTAWSDPVFPQARANGRQLAVRAAPVPWNGRDELRFETSEPLPAGGRLRIFRADGSRAADLRWPDGARALAWDGRTGRGRPLASGIYLYRLEAAGRANRGGTFLLLR